MKTHIILVMGVSGSGKTTLGTALAQHLGWAFADADDHHPQSNRDKMARGEPLTDTDREPWLRNLRALIEQHLQSHLPLVLACSALKESYREILTRGSQGIQIVFMHGDRELIAQRLQTRSGHYMPASLLDSQLATLESPTDAILADIRKPIHTLLGDVLAQLP